MTRKEIKGQKVISKKDTMNNRKGREIQRRITALLLCNPKKLPRFHCKLSTITPFKFQEV